MPDELTDEQRDRARVLYNAYRAGVGAYPFANIGPAAARAWLAVEEKVKADYESKLKEDSNRLRNSNSLLARRADLAESENVRLRRDVLKFSAEVLHLECRLDTTDWQPIKPEAIQPGMRVRRTEERGGVTFVAVIARVARVANETVFSGDQGLFFGRASWEVDPNMIPVDPRIAVVRAYYDTVGINSSDASIRDLLAQLDAMGGDES